MADADPRAPLVRRVRIRNYKSIASCDVELASLTVLVGPNGAGKSNFLDALGFVSDGLRSTLDNAVRERGGLRMVRRHGASHPRTIEIALELDLAPAEGGASLVSYALELDSSETGEVQVAREKLTLGSGGARSWYEVERGRVTGASVPNMPPAQADRLYLVVASGLPQFRSVYDALTSMAVYNFDPGAMRRPQSPDAGELLRRDGSNIASVIGRLEREHPAVNQRIREYLRVIVPGIQGFVRVDVGPQETLRFEQDVDGAAAGPWTLYAMAMSDGTLRALATLAAAVQPAGRGRVRLVGFEEPDTALHPAAAGALLDALREATVHTQVLLTTHSPELLDGLDLARDKLLVVRSVRGTTDIAEVDRASVSAIEDGLLPASDLLRMNQLEPDPGHLAEQQQRFAALEPLADG